MLKLVTSLLILLSLAWITLPVSADPSIQEEPREEGMRRRRFQRQDDFPALLSETGFYADVAKKQFAKGLIPYELRAELWTDGAQKERFMLLPEGKTLGWGKKDHFIFPDGTRFMFTLFIEEEGDRLYLESRMIEIEKGRLSFATYQWREDQTEADRVRRGGEFFANYGHSSQLWKITADNRCLRCHSRAADLILGVKPKQLDREVTVAGKKVNQLDSWKARGLITDMPEDRSHLKLQADPRDESLSLEVRARSYLDVNCGSCHVPGGHGSGTLDLREDTPMHLTGMIKMTEDFTMDGGVLIPGDWEYSMLLRRMRTVSEARMPDELSTVQDAEGIKLLEAWIKNR